RLGGSTYRDERVRGRPETDFVFYRPIMDENLDLCKAFPSLRSLTVTQGAITDAGLTRLAVLTRLRRLYIGRSPITNAGLKELEKLPRLHVIELSDTGVTDSGAAKLKETLPYALILVERHGEYKAREAQGNNYLRTAVVVIMLGGLVALMLFW